MADRPILFSAPMARALLAGRKTQTRRIIKPQPQIRPEINECSGHFEIYNGDELAGRLRMKAVTGDRLWVKETWRAHGWHSDCVEIAYAAQRGVVGWSEQHEQIKYPDGNRNAFKYYAPKGPDFWRPSIFMPRWGSRITLMVTDVRVERLQDISEADANAEGIERANNHPVFKLYRDYCALPKSGDGAIPAVDSYRSLWNHINGEGAWEANPWVVAYTFTVHLGNIGQIGRAA
ncbi:hypothetical protein G6L07_08210 [Agrobacterium rhizogenes]|nr:hypothetical protein [Rhizobium rhizogenes]